MTYIPDRGDASTNTSSSVDGEAVLFSGTGGKTLKRSALTGIIKQTSGVASVASQGTDYYAPGGTDVAVTDGGTGASTASGARINLGLPMLNPDATYNYIGVNENTIAPSTQVDSGNGYLGGFGLSTAGLGAGTRENWIARSKTLSNATWAKTNASASDDSQADPFGVASSASRVTGTASGADLVNTSTSNTTTGFHTASVWLKMVTPGTVPTVKIKLTTSADSVGAETTHTLPVGKWYRISVPLNCASAHTSKSITVTVNDNVVDWWGAQGNSGAEPFAPSITTSGSVAKTSGRIFSPLLTLDLGAGANTQGLTASSTALTASQDLAVSTGAKLLWFASEVTGTTQALVAHQEYVANNAGLVTLTLPTSGAGVGSRIAIIGKGAGGWKIAQNTSQIIHSSTFGDTTSGTGGSLSSGARYDCVTLKCIVANTEWVVQDHEGTLAKV